MGKVRGGIKIIVELIKLNNGVAAGIKLSMSKAPLLLVKAEKGFIMCGYLNIATANSLGDVAAKVTGVSSFEDVLEAEVVEVTEEARKLGIKEGIRGREALEKMF
ncbi:MAG: DUF1805 domain-containing protein [Candidatus Hydrothermarchaeota archaeon]|jgi:uncharacterized protein YunC (DUF1805 family)|nr:DUF1805 domain-containing protein [Candidatus Hydrothermarchaeota archaeon]MDP6613130.1 DUF1805 domain-containing protein [Candidatus Hydrothermarchaeota archaeon]